MAAASVATDALRVTVPFTGTAMSDAVRATLDDDATVSALGSTLTVIDLGDVQVTAVRVPTAPPPVAVIGRAPLSLMLVSGATLATVTLESVGVIVICTCAVVIWV